MKDAFARRQLAGSRNDVHRTASDKNNATVDFIRNCHFTISLFPDQHLLISLQPVF
jgi:hypothetical protein